MAKFENKFDINSAKKELDKHKAAFTAYLSINKQFSTLLQSLVNNSNIKALIFAKSIAFRIGKSSIKTISGFPSGFKASATDVVGVSKSVVNTKTTALSKDKIVTLAAAYFLIFDPGRVSAEEDATEAAETEQVINTVSDLRRLMDGSKSITIVLGKEKYEIDNFSQVSGRPKADAVFSLRNQPVIFCSLKKGRSAGDFQQYGGWASDLGISTRADINQYPEFKQFVERIENIFKFLGQKKDNNDRYDFNVFNKGSNFATYLNDEKLANMVMFGKDYGSTRFGLNNCQILIDGDVKFKKVTGGYTIEGEFHTQLNPLLEVRKPVFKIDENDIYTPALFVYKSESQGLNQGGFSNARASIWPNNKVIRSYIKLTKDVESAIKSKNTAQIKAITEKLLK